MFTIFYKITDVFSFGQILYLFLCTKHHFAPYFTKNKLNFILLSLSSHLFSSKFIQMSCASDFLASAFVFSS